MRVRMLVTISGTRDGVDWPRAGEPIEVSTDEGAALVVSGLATVAPPPESAAATTAAETATMRKPSRRKA